jgi:hypothetical protein
VALPPFDDPLVTCPLIENMAARARTDEAVDRYRRDLGTVFQGCARILKKTGICVFTYHHKSPAAWSAVGEALVRSGFRCVHVLPLRGEGRGGFHSYPGTIKWDAVLVCRPAVKVERAKQGAKVVVSPHDVAEARGLADRWGARLRCLPRLGFRPPDEISLFRALVVARARLRTRTTRWIPLVDALVKPPGTLLREPGTQGKEYPLCRT